MGSSAHPNHHTDVGILDQLYFNIYGYDIFKLLAYRLCFINIMWVFLPIFLISHIKTVLTRGWKDGPEIQSIYSFAKDLNSTPSITMMVHNHLLLQFLRTELWRLTWQWNETTCLKEPGKGSHSGQTLRQKLGAFLFEAFLKVRNSVSARESQWRKFIYSYKVKKFSLLIREKMMGFFLRLKW